MNQWFECKVSYGRQGESDNNQKVTEIYLVDALSFTEAEERITKEISPMVSYGELDIVNIKRVRLSEVVESDEAQDDRYYRAKVNFVTIDEKAGKEKRTAQNWLLKSGTLQGAVERLTKELSSYLDDNYEIHTVTETAILDLFHYNHGE